MRHQYSLSLNPAPEEREVGSALHALSFPPLAGGGLRGREWSGAQRPHSRSEAAALAT